MKITMSNPRLENYRNVKKPSRMFAIDFVAEAGSFKHSGTFRAGLLSVKPSEFPRPLRTKVAEYQENHSYRRLVIYWEEILNEAAKFWQPNEKRIIHAIANDALAYIENPSFGEFVAFAHFGECDKALEAFNTCRSASDLLVYGEKMSTEEIRRLAEWE